jgi:hypothetical protein
MLGSVGGSWTIGMMMHFANGAIIFPAMYAYVVFARLPGSPAVRSASSPALLRREWRTPDCPNAVSEA